MHPIKPLKPSFTKNVTVQSHFALFPGQDLIQRRRQGIPSRVRALIAADLLTN